MRAQEKQLVWFEHSGHIPMTEERGKFLLSLVRYAWPIAQKGETWRRDTQIGTQKLALLQSISGFPVIPQSLTKASDKPTSHARSLFSVAARRSMVCPTASRPMRVTAP